MIIKGKSRSDPVGLAKHLGNAEKNERITVLETKGTVATDLRGALVEMEAISAGTRCEKSLYHAAISPGPPHRLSPEQREEAIKDLEEKLGLTGHARVVVMHEKLGREHIHIVWSRININTMRSVSDSHNYRKHEEVARELERKFGHERVQGAHHEREGVERPDRTPSRAELRQEERTGIKGKDVKREVTEAFRASDSPEAFRAALEDRGFVLAKGDKRDFVIVDREGGIHSLARRLEDLKAAELRKFMAPIDRESLPTAERAKGIQFDRAHGIADNETWEQALAKSAIEKAKSEEDRLLEELKEAHAKARLEAAYARGDDYVTQSSAAQRDFEKRQSELNDSPRPVRPSDHAQDSDRSDEERAIEIRDREARRNAANRVEQSLQNLDQQLDQHEVKDAKQERVSRAHQKEISDQNSVDREDWSPDRQREAPDGGRTRSR